jgi:hypothetical protein
MSNGNVVEFSEKEKDEEKAYHRKLGAYKETYFLLMPVVERMREMGLTSSEISRPFKFLGDDVFPRDEQQRPKPTA